jgi:SH3-like domain-containing protein
MQQIRLLWKGVATLDTPPFLQNARGPRPKDNLIRRPGAKAGETFQLSIVKSPDTWTRIECDGGAWEKDSRSPGTRSRARAVWLRGKRAIRTVSHHAKDRAAAL